MIAALMVCVAFSQNQDSKIISQKNSGVTKTINELRTIVNIDTGYAVLQVTYPQTSNLDVLLEILDSNNKTYLQQVKLFKNGSTEVNISPKYGNITMINILSITPAEDEYYYYTF